MHSCWLFSCYAPAGRTNIKHTYTKNTIWKIINFQLKRSTLFPSKIESLSEAGDKKRTIIREISSDTSINNNKNNINNTSTGNAFNTTSQKIFTQNRNFGFDPYNFSLESSYPHYCHKSHTSLLLTNSEQTDHHIYNFGNNNKKRKTSFAEGISGIQQRADLTVKMVRRSQRKTTAFIKVSKLIIKDS